MTEILQFVAGLVGGLIALNLFLDLLRRISGD